MLTVACVLKSGRFERAAYKDGYTADDVLRLKNMVADNLGEHRFVCFSDVDVPCERIELQHRWPGWWSKIELFSQVFDDTVLYFDLDTVISGDLRDIASHPHQFTMLKDFGMKSVHNSGVMAWRGDYTHIYERFKKDPRRYMVSYLTPPKLGDQAYISDVQKPIESFQDLWPGAIVSYKWHCVGKPRSDDVRVVCFHGQPKGAGSAGWVKEIWSKANGCR